MEDVQQLVAISASSAPGFSSEAERSTGITTNGRRGRGPFRKRGLPELLVFPERMLLGDEKGVFNCIEKATMIG